MWKPLEWMNRKRFKAEKTVNTLREADVPLSKRQMVARACEHIHVTVGASRFHVVLF